MWRRFLGLRKPAGPTPAPASARWDEGVLTHAAFKARAHPVIDRALAAHGLDRVSDYLWAAPGDLDIRPVFALRLFKGAAVLPVWGVSLGFVPHVSGDRAAWHRTRKSARPDLYEVPPDRAGELSLAGAEDRVAERVAAALAPVLPRAATFWAIARQGDLDALLARAESSTGPLQPFSSPINGDRDIVRAFLAARRGDAEKARAALAAVDWPDPAAQEALAARLATALSGPGAPKPVQPR